MSKNTRLDEEIVKKDSAYLQLAKEYDNCVFKQCDFSESVLTSFDFIDCRFEDCNLSLVKLNNTGLKSCDFINCKMTGIDFEPCNDFLFSVSFRACQLDFSSFHKKKLKKTPFIDCSLKETDWNETDITEAVFDNCNLELATFYRANLEKADFRTAYNFSINPNNNRMKKAKFSLSGLPGLLAEYDIVIH